MLFGVRALPGIQEAWILFLSMPLYPATSTCFPLGSGPVRRAAALVRVSFLGGCAQLRGCAAASPGCTRSQHGPTAPGPSPNASRDTRTSYTSPEPRGRAAITRPSRPLVRALKPAAGPSTPNPTSIGGPGGALPSPSLPRGAVELHRHATKSERSRRECVPGGLQPGHGGGAPGAEPSGLAGAPGPAAAQPAGRAAGPRRAGGQGAAGPGLPPRAGRCERPGPVPLCSRRAGSRCTGCWCWPGCARGRRRRRRQVGGGVARPGDPQPHAVTSRSRCRGSCWCRAKIHGASHISWSSAVKCHKYVKYCSKYHLQKRVAWSCVTGSTEWRYKPCSSP